MAIQGRPVAPTRRALVIAHGGEIGDENLVKTHLDALNSFSPTFIGSLFSGETWLFSRQEGDDKLLAGLRKAGLSD